MDTLNVDIVDMAPHPSMDEGPLVVVADVGATYTRVAVAKGANIGPIRKLATSELGREPEVGLSRGLAHLMEEIIADAGRNSTERGVSGDVRAGAVGVAAVVGDGSVVANPVSIGIPAGTVLRDALTEHLGIPFLVDNDANMAAIGELHYGTGRGLSSFVILTLGTNLGAGIVLDKKIHHGAGGGAGEVGMLLVPARNLEAFEHGGRMVEVVALGSGRSRAPDGYAWIEELVGGGAMGAAYRRAAAGSASAVGDRAVRNVLRAATQGDVIAAEITHQALEGWAFAIASMIAVLDPEAILLTGGLIPDAIPFLDALRKRTQELARVQTRIELAALGEMGALIGASHTAGGIASGLDIKGESNVR